MNNKIILDITDADYWNFILRGDASINPSINDSGQLEVGKYAYHIYKTLLDETKQYTIYFDVATVGNYLYLGVCNDTTTPTNIYLFAAKSENNVSTGSNKAVLTYENSKWGVSFNNGTRIVYNLSDNAYILISTANSNNALGSKITKIIQENRGG